MHNKHQYLLMTPERLKEIYDSLPKLDCKQKCQDSCSYVWASKFELQLIKKILREQKKEYKPFKTLKTATYLKHKREGTLANLVHNCRCPYLNEKGLCSIYKFRPLICRLWGLTERMKCPFGCVPERWLSEEEFRKIMIELYEEMGKGIIPLGLSK